MYDRNYFGMMMVETSDADAFLLSTYSAAHSVGKIAKEVIGIRPSYDHFATLHIVNTKRGTFFISDTQVNKTVDEDTLVDIARLTRNSVEYFSHDPVIAMVSYSNFGSVREEECLTVRKAVERMQTMYPDLAIDGEMGLNYALNSNLRDTTPTQDTPPPPEEKGGKGERTKWAPTTPIYQQNKRKEQARTRPLHPQPPPTPPTRSRPRPPLTPNKQHKKNKTQPKY